MRSPRARLALALAATPLLALPAGVAHAITTAPTTDTVVTSAAGDIVPGQYIVTLEEPTQRGVGEDVRSARVSSLRRAVATARQRGINVHREFTAVGGYVATMTPEQAQAMSATIGVRSVEPDRIVSISANQNDATWGLDRIDQRSLPLNDTYTSANDGAGVTAYIIDTGINASHSEFSGRLTSGFDAVDNDSDPADCHGHGTHVAGTVAGTTYGVAKAATISAVRVLNCRGSGTSSQVIGGMDWVARNASGPAVANMSLGGYASSAEDRAIQRMTEAGVTVAVAAGNDNENACDYSPARAPEAITVGSTTSSDARSDFSNYGTCLDIFAPGSGITSAWIGSRSATKTISGTSMASPHVAGVAVLYKSAHPGATPAQVEQALVNGATSGAVRSPGSGSPNKLLFAGVAGDDAPSDPGPTPDPTPTPTPTPTDPCGSLNDTGSLGSREWKQVGDEFWLADATTVKACLSGPSGTDFDLFLERRGFWGWSRVASSQGWTSDETIETRAIGGHYRWRVLSYRGNGEFRLRHTH